jgi:cyanate permease
MVFSLMRPDSIRLSRRHKIAFYTVLSVVFVSGVVWAWLHYFSQADNEFGSSPAQAWTLTIHGLFAAMSLLLIGSLLPLHVKYAWRAQRNRTNGIFFISIVALLILTGYGLYYIGNERLRSWTSWIHLFVGLAFPVLLVFHIWRGRSSRKVKRSHAQRRTAQKTLVR